LGSNYYSQSSVIIFQNRIKKSTVATPATRSATSVWLLGHPLANIEEINQLPVSRTALCRLFYEMKTNKATLPVACSTVADQITLLWVKANVETTADSCCCQAEISSQAVLRDRKAQGSTICCSVEGRRRVHV